MFLYYGPTGAPLYVPTCSYVNRDEAHQIVQHFLKTKRCLILLNG